MQTLTDIFKGQKLEVNDQCFEYSENEQALKALLSEIQVSVKPHCISKDFFNQEEKENRQIITVYIERGNKRIDFEFGMSINDTQAIEPSNGTYTNRFQGKFYDYQYVMIKAIAKAKQKIAEGLLYSLLACMRSDYYIQETFEDFCADFGCNEDSKKDTELYFRCQKQSTKLKKIFTAIDIECLPN